MATEVGFIGLGIMGQPMALNLIKAGYKLTVYNRTASKAEPLKTAGATVASTPAEAVKNAEFVVSIVSDTNAMEEVVTGKGGALETLRPGAVWIDSSTISPVFSVKLSRLMGEKGAKLLDAPVTGSKHGAEKGELLFMIGGEDDALKKAKPLIDVMGKKFVHLGGNGKGLSCKVSMNAILATQLLIFCEAILLAKKAGVDPQQFLDVMQSSFARSHLVDFKAPFIFKGDFTPFFPLGLMHKDLSLALENAYANNVPMPTTAAVKEVFGAGKAQGKGDLDIGAVITVLEDLTGEKVRVSNPSS